MDLLELKIQNEQWKIHWMDEIAIRHWIKIIKTEDIVVESMQTEAEIFKKEKKTEVSLSYLQHNIKWSNIYVIGAPGREKRILKNHWNK